MSDSPVFWADNEDPEMQRAIKRARQTFRFFWREVSWEQRRIIPGLDVACVKVAFWDDGDPSDEDVPVEQMWVSDVDFDGAIITGTLINQPNWLNSVSEGDDVEIKPNQLSDWMYAINNKVFGAFTVNFIRSQMPKGERKAHDDAWGMDFGSPSEVKLVPPDFLGKGARSGSQTPAEVGAVEHPMALNMCESLAEFASDPANLNSTDDKGFTVLHSLALAGAAKGVSILLEHGADPTQPAANGMTPAMLAKKLGWKQVQQVLADHGQRHPLGKIHRFCGRSVQIRRMLCVI